MPASFARADLFILFLHSQAALDALALSAAGSARQATPALAGLTRLAAVESLSRSQAASLAAAVAAAAASPDDAVALRALQTAASLAQTPALADAPGGVAALLGAAGRLLTGGRGPTALATTAAATARQVAAVAFGRAAASPPGSPARGAALALLFDLCALASATGDPPHWASGGPPGRAHALALLDVALSAGAPLFDGSDTPFADALRSGVRLALLTALQASLTDGGARGPPPAARADRAAAACAATRAADDATAALRAARTALGAHHAALGGRAAPLVGVLVAGAARTCPPHQRAAVLRVLRDACGDADLLLFLHAEFDARASESGGGGGGAPPASPRAAPRAALSVLAACADAVDAALAPDGGGIGDMRALSGNRDTVDWPSDALAGGAGDGASRADRAAAAAAARDAGRRGAALALDGLLQFCAAAARLGDDAAATTVRGDPAPRGAAAAALVADGWRPAADALVALVRAAAADDEDGVARGLRGLQALARAAGALQLAEPRDALLARLASLALPDGGTAVAAASTHRTTIDGSPPRARPPSAPLDRARSGGLDAALTPALVLAPAHVQSLRALFNAAHTLGPGLDAGGWRIILAAVARLDAALAAPGTAVDERGADGGARDLDVLRGAADALFAASGSFGDAAVDGLASALVDVAAGEAAAAAAAGAPPGAGLHALRRAGDVLLANPGRLPVLWPRLSAALRGALASPSPAARAAAVDALRRALDGVLTLARGFDDAGDGEAAALADSAALGGAGEAYSAARGDAERAGVLAAVEAALARHGDRLTGPGWEAALKLLAAAPAAPGAGAAPARAGFAAVQAAADAASALPPHLLSSYLDATAAYVRQDGDVNVALAAVGALWSAADALRRGGGGDAAATTTTLRRILAHLAAASADPRAEVRDCAVRTLASVLDGAAPALDARAWGAALADALLPVARAVAKRAAAAATAATAPPPADPGAGAASPALVLHHSRDTERKRWDETLALALSCIGRLLRAHAPTLGAAPGLVEGWDEVMAYAEAALAGGARDVAAASLAAASAGLDAPGLPRAVRDRSLRALAVAVEAAAAPDACRAPQAARLELASTLAGLLALDASGRAGLTPADAAALFGGLARLAASPRATGDPALPAGAVPAVPRAVLAALPALAPPPHPSLWPHLLAVAGAAAAAGGHPSRVSAPGAAATAAAGATCLASLFCGPAPWRARAASLAAAADALAPAAAARFDSRPAARRAWRAAAAALADVTGAGVPALGLAATSDDGGRSASCDGGDAGPPPDARLALAALAATYRALLVGPLKSLADDAGHVDAGKKDGADEAAADADAEAAAVDALADGPLAGVDGVPADALAPLARVLADAVGRPRARALAAGARFDQLALRKLHVAVARGADAGASQATIAASAAALPCYVGAVRAALARAADRGPPAELAAAALDSALTLEAHPVAVDAAAAAAPAVGALLALLRASRGGPAPERAHLLLLHGALAHAAATADAARTRGAAAEALQVAGGLLGLGGGDGR